MPQIDFAVYKNLVKGGLGLSELPKNMFAFQ